MQHLVPQEENSGTCQRVSRSIVAVEDFKYNKKDSYDKYRPTDTRIVGFGAGDVSTESADGFVIVHDSGVVIFHLVLIGQIWITEDRSV